MIDKGAISENFLSLIKELLANTDIKDDVKFDIDMPLIGGASALDSMKLVELCLALQDKASDMGFEFDWTSDTAMSKSRSIFRTVRSLTEEFISQAEDQK